MSGVVSVFVVLWLMSCPDIIRLWQTVFGKSSKLTLQQIQQGDLVSAANHKDVPQAVALTAGIDFAGGTEAVDARLVINCFRALLNRRLKPQLTWFAVGALVLVLAGLLAAVGVNDMASQRDSLFLAAAGYAASGIVLQLVLVWFRTTGVAKLDAAL